MLNEVTRLTKGDFSKVSNLPDFFEVWQMDEFTPAFLKATYNTEDEANKFVNENIGLDDFTVFEVRKRLKYEDENCLNCKDRSWCATYNMYKTVLKCKHWSYKK